MCFGPPLPAVRDHHRITISPWHGDLCEEFIGPHSIAAAHNVRLGYGRRPRGMHRQRWLWRGGGDPAEAVERTLLCNEFSWRESRTAACTCGWQLLSAPGSGPLPLAAASNGPLVARARARGARTYALTGGHRPSPPYPRPRSRCACSAETTASSSASWITATTIYHVVMDDQFLSSSACRWLNCEPRTATCTSSLTRSCDAAPTAALGRSASRSSAEEAQPACAARPRALRVRHR